MKIKIGELLVKNNLITVTQLQQGLKAQRVYGGKLGTNLVELGYLSETQLTQFLAKQLELPAAVASDFENIRPSVIDIVPKDLAARLKVIPLEQDQKQIKIAFSDPLDYDARETLAFNLGKRIVPVVAPEILITFALEKYYHVPREDRFVQLGEDENTADGTAELNDLLVRNTEVLDEESEISKVSLIRDVGRYSLQHLRSDLYHASSREQVFKSLFRLLETRCSEIAVFIARHNEIWGWLQQGFSLEEKQFKRKWMTMEDMSAIARVFRQKDLDLKVHLEPLDKRVLEQMHADPESTYQLFPLLLSGRVVSVIMTANLQQHQQEEMVQEIQEALLLCSVAMQMVSLRRKLAPPAPKA